LETAVKKLYEAMFLVDSTQASDWDTVVKTIETVLKRSDAEIVAIRNWAERKLAYEIDHKTRGAYALCFFKADGSSIPNIEKDVQLSEQILRALILSTETREKRDIEKDMHGTQDEKQPSAEEAPREISSPQEADKDDDTASLQGPEADEAQKSAAPYVSDAIEPQLLVEPELADAIEPLPTDEPELADAIEPPPTDEPELADAIEPPPTNEPELADAIEPPPTNEPEPVDAIEPPPTETEEDAAEKDATN
jgi:ribosomal protein S6